MTPPINIDGSKVTGITIDGTDVSEVTVDGEVVFGNAIPDADLLHAHYDFSEEDGSTPVKDLSRNGHDLDSGSYTGVGDTINGLQAGEFDGSDDGVYGPSFSDIRNDYAAFAVVDAESAGSTSRIIKASDSGNYALSVDSGGSWRTYFGSNGPEKGASTNPTILASIDDGDGGTNDIALRENGSQVASTNAGTGGFTHIGIGSQQPGGTGSNFDGAIGEILIYKSTPTIADVESYLSDKWGITV